MEFSTEVVAVNVKRDQGVQRVRLQLNLLGLVVTVPNNIVLDITAVSGPGNLLGSLLCAVANLLNQSPSPLQQIVALLNQIIALL